MPVALRPESPAHRVELLTTPRELDFTPELIALLPPVGKLLFTVL